MARMAPFSTICMVFSVVIMVSSWQLTLGVGDAPNKIGVCYGTLGDNLPPPPQVVAMYSQYGVDSMRIYNPNHDILQALHNRILQGGNCIYVSVGVANEDIQSISQSQDAANQWVQSNIVPFSVSCVNYVTVGNEAIPGPYAGFVASAMHNLRAALDSFSLLGVQVTTVVPGNVLATSYPPSTGQFSDEIVDDMSGVLYELATHGVKLMVNVYPYFAYSADPDHIALDYAQFTTTAPVFTDNGLEYWYLFDAMIDAFYSAMEKAGAPTVGLIVSESGWPSDGNGEFTHPSLAQTYNTNLRDRITKGGTPKRPNDVIEAFVFAMFNEDQKPDGQEQHFGLFNPDGTPVYPFF